ncbi:putative MFS family arabinose efflux permease [Haloactinopolyspora alba]|uniref:Putative MFS family arabinose efflux permease n=1 Tax=Haloactinopolyspora alba TaxID=648780 RepID=A0A2P8DLZ4_9ACTN|nr:MFS transporter [Haloactinopolyspora alba]PSK98250.1 putative MFS family arabinose efflux permease [Haloactinopolyspora alba]
MSPTFHSLRHRDFRLYWSGMFVSNVGTWMQRVAQDWLVLEVLHGGGQAVGITTGLQFLPFLLVAPFGGLLADKLPKRKLLVFTNAFMGAVGLALGVLALTGLAEIWHVYVLAFLLGVGTALDNPARQAFVSELVGPDDLTNAIALNSASFNAARLIGPAVAGGLIALVGTGWVFVINGVSFASPIIALIVLRTIAVAAATSDDDQPGALSRLREGVAYIRSRPDLVMVLVVMFGVGTFGMNFQMTMALMATEIYDKGPHEYGVLGSIMAIGTLSGALIAARRRVPRRRLIVGGAVVFGALEVLAGTMPTYLLFAASLVPIGVVAMTVLTAANAYIQTTVPTYVRGRVLSLYIMILMGGTPAGAPIIGWVADQFGARWSLLGGGLLTIGCTVAGFVLLAPRSGIAVRARMRPFPRLVATSTGPAVDTAESHETSTGARAGAGGAAGHRRADAAPEGERAA